MPKRRRDDDDRHNNNNYYHTKGWSAFLLAAALLTWNSVLSIDGFSKVGVLTMSMAKQLASPLVVMPASGNTTSATTTATSHASSESILVLTGASENHGDVLEEFLRDHAWLRDMPNFSLVVFDYGLSASRRQALEVDPALTYITDWISFNFSHYPPHVDINVNAGEYAWKPLSIAQASERHHPSVIVWLDAGIRFASGPRVLTQMVALIRRTGHYTAESSGTVRQWVHPGTLQKLWHPPAVPAAAAAAAGGDNDNNKIDKDIILDLPMASGGICGLRLWDNRHYDEVDTTAGPVVTQSTPLLGATILNEYVDCALEKECIAPTGSSRRNHRQDQAVLTLLLYKYYGTMLRFSMPASKDAVTPVFTDTGIYAQLSQREPQNVMRQRWAEKAKQQEQQTTTTTVAIVVNLYSSNN